MRTSRAFTFLTVLLALSLVWVKPGSLQAQTRVESLQRAQAETQTSQPNRFALEISPPVKYIQIKPGAKLSHTIILKNIGAFALEISPTVVDFVPDGESNVPVLKKSTTFEYIEVPEGGWPTLALRPNQTAQLTLNFSVPADVPEKEYPLTVLFEQRPLDSSGDGSRVTGALGSNLIVLISNKNTPIPDLTISSLGIFPLLDMFSVLSIDPLITNNGFSAQPIQGTITIRNWRGTVLKEFVLYPDVVLGNSSRRARALAPTSTTEEATTPEPAPLTYESDWLLGVYQVDLQLTYSEAGNEAALTQIPLTSQRVTVVALPYVAITALVVGTLIAVLYQTITARKVRL